MTDMSDLAQKHEVIVEDLEYAGGKITLRKFEGEPHTFISQNPTKPASIA